MVVVRILGVIIVLSGIAAAIWYGMPGFQDGLKDPELISVRVKLKNLCGVGDDTFIVREPSTGISAKFSEGVAYMRLYSNRKIQLAVSSRYPDFQYSGEMVSVADEVTMVADCSSSPRQRQFFGTMRDQFKQKN